MKSCCSFPTWVVYLATNQLTAEHDPDCPPERRGPRPTKENAALVLNGTFPERLTRIWETPPTGNLRCIHILFQNENKYPPAA